MPSCLHVMCTQHFSYNLIISDIFFYAEIRVSLNEISLKQLKQHILSFLTLSLWYLLQAPCVASEKVIIIDCKFVASRVFYLNCSLKLGLIV